MLGQLAISNSPSIIDNNDMYMRKHQLSVGKEMLKSKATLLPPPTIVYGNGKVVDSEHCGEWEAIRNEPVRTVLPEAVIDRKTSRVKVLVGSIIAIHHPFGHDDSVMTNIDTAPFNRLMYAVELAGQPIYWADREKNIPWCMDIHHFYPNTQTPQELYKYIRGAQHHVETDSRYHNDAEQKNLFSPQPIFFLLFATRCSTLHVQQNDYNMLKHLCDNDLGVYTQGMLHTNYNQVSPDAATCRFTCHIVEKILAKVGTTHRKLERGTSHRPWMMLTDPKAPTLVLGIDVSHPKPEDRDNKKRPESYSVASIVGNIDTDVTQFRASSRIQDIGQEQIIDMTNQIEARLGDFILNTKTKPAHIVVYRDGISEGDFQRYLYEEKRAIEKACEKYDCAPTITYIVVSKRHHTMFFPVNPDETYAAHEFNVKPGTLVEDVVTSSEYYEFFLATQIGQKGTSRPTHYYVLHDTWKPLDLFWPAISHALTYNFCRTTSTIALPAPVMYAHLAAKRAKETFDASVHCTMLALPPGGQMPDMSELTVLLDYEKKIHMNQKLDGMVFV